MAEKVKQENTIIKSDFYKELKTQRGIIESQLIFSLYGDTNYFFDYPVNPNDISNSMWRFYYHMLKEMVEDRGLKTLDAVSVGAYVNSKEEKIQKAYSEAMKAIENNPTVDVPNSYVPLQHQYKGLRVDEHPELLEDREWSNATFNGDRVGVQTSDVILAIYIPEEEDVGMGIELGMARALGKYNLIVIPDEDWGKPMYLSSFHR